MLKSKRERFLLIVTILVVGGIGGYLVIFEPLVAKWQSMREQLDLTIKKVHSLEKLKETGIKEQFEKVASGLSIEGDINAMVLTEIDALAREAGITSKDLQPLPMQGEGIFRIVSYKLNIETNVQNLAHFFGLLEHKSSLLEVEEMQLVPYAKRGETNIRANLKISRLTVSEESKDDKKGKSKSSSKHKRR